MRYEELVRNPDKVQSFLSEQISWLKQTALFTDYQKNSKPSLQSLTAMHGVRQIEMLSIGRWHQHLPRLAGQLLQHGPITKELIEDGYEKDEAWLNELVGVQPDLSPGRLREFLSLHQRITRNIKIGFDLARLFLHQQIEN